jgi:gamma-glutamylcyclotransferase (GGCT)/AIG2-like uncharacterized protein YtfP
VTEHLFVYGTLRAGAHVMHGVLAEAADLLGHARVRGWYPGLVPTIEDRWVVGEIWSLRQPSVLERLDAYEGDEYERRSITVQLHDGTAVEAWTYIYRTATPLAPVIDSGDWMLHRRSNDG